VQNDAPVYLIKDTYQSQVSASSCLEPRRDIASHPSQRGRPCVV